MDNEHSELQELFAHSGSALGPDVIAEIQSILRLHDISPQELFYKWESYSIMMGIGQVVIDLKMIREFKASLQSSLERASWAKAAQRNHERRAMIATPRAPALGKDMMFTLENLIPGRLADSHAPSHDTSTNDRPNLTSPKLAPRIVDSLNAHLDIRQARCSLGDDTPRTRVKLKSYTDMTQFERKTMYLKFSEASDALNDRIEQFVDVVKETYQLEDSIFGNPASPSPSEIIAVGRVASDNSESRLTLRSLVLESSRRFGAGLRVPLSTTDLKEIEFFMGKIIALRGFNAAGEYLSISEILRFPLLPFYKTSIEDLDAFNARLTLPSPNSKLPGQPSKPSPFSILVAAGPYTQDDALSFTHYKNVLNVAKESLIDCLILIGPFIDIGHPKVCSGEIDLPDIAGLDPDQASMIDLFRYFISLPLFQLTQAHPGIQIVMCPSVRDAVCRSVAWPLDRLPGKALNLPRQVSLVTSPMTFGINEIVIGMSSLDVLEALRKAECVSQAAQPSATPLERVLRQVLEQRHFFPVFPPPRAMRSDSCIVNRGKRSSQEPPDKFFSFEPTATPIDLSHLYLGEISNNLPDILITPSILTPFVKVVESVIAINPGMVSKPKGPGTYAKIMIDPINITPQDRATGAPMPARLHDRSKIEITRL